MTVEHRLESGAIRLGGGRFAQAAISRRKELPLTADAMLNATVRLLIKHGLEGASARTIAEATQLPVSTVQRRFPFRGGAVAALVDRTLLVYVLAMDRTFEEIHDLPLEAGLRMLGDAHIRAVAKYRLTAQTALRYLPAANRTETYQAVKEAMAARLTVYLSRTIPQGTIAAIRVLSAGIVERVDLVTQASLLGPKGVAPTVSSIRATWYPVAYDPETTIRSETFPDPETSRATIIDL